MSENESTLLRKYFPGGKDGQIIVTSRNRSVASDIDAECLLVGDLTDQEAVELLGNSTGMESLALNSQARDLLSQIAVELLARHPLAVAQAGAYVRNLLPPRTWGVEGSLFEYKKRFLNREAKMLNAENGSLVRDYGKSVIASWNLSFQIVLDKNPTAAKLFLFLGFLHHTEIPQDLFARAYESKREIQAQDGVILEDKPYSWMKDILGDVDDDCGEWNASNLGHCMSLLESYSLVRILKGPTYSVHPLVHAWTRLGDVASAEDLEANAQLALVFLSHMSIIDYERSPRGTAVHLRFISHLESCIRFAQKHTALLKLQGVQPQPKLRSQCLLEIHRLLNGQAMDPELGMKELPANLAVLATVSGSVHEGLDYRSTLLAIALLLKNISSQYTYCADIVVEVSEAMLRLTPRSTSDDDRHCKAEKDFEFRLLIIMALRHIATPEELDVAEMQTLEWAENHREEMNPGFYISRKVGVMALACIRGLDHSARLSRLENCLSKLMTELGDESHHTWAIRSAIGHCLLKMGKKQEAVSLFEFIRERCSNMQSDMRFIVRQATHSLILILNQEESYSELANFHRSVEESYAKELGPYHLDTLREKNSRMHFQNKLLPYEQSREFPNIVEFNCIFLPTHPNPCLEERDIEILQSALYCKALGTESEIGLFWDGVIDQSKLLPDSDSLFWSFAFALETAAAAGDRQGHHHVSSSLRKGADTLRARKLTTGGGESKVAAMKRLRRLWDRLTTLHEAADASSTSGDASQCFPIASSVYSNVIDAPVKAQPAMVWLVTHYIMWLLKLKACRKISPVSSSFMGNFHGLSLKYFGGENLLTYMVMGAQALCSRLLGQEETALQLEDEIVKKRVREGIDVSRGITYRHLKAAVTMEILVNAYRGREWYAEAVRPFESVVEAFTKHFGGAAEETMTYVRFMIELYGRLGWVAKIDTTLESMLRASVQGEQQRRFADQILSVVKWCSIAGQILTAHHVLLWLVSNGNLDSTMRIACFRDLAMIAEKLGKDDSVRDYEERRIECERESARLEIDRAEG